MKKFITVDNLQFPLDSLGFCLPLILLAAPLPRCARELTTNLVFNCISVNLTWGNSLKKTNHRVL